jgi:hypothetical protein
MVDEILKQRGENYGSFGNQANLTQTLNNIILHHYNTVHKDTPLPPVMAEAIHMICHKLARVANGNPYYDDSWQDIAGYAQLIVDVLQEAREAAKQPPAEETTTINLTE